MSGNFKGVQSVIREVHPAVLCVHCSAHSLNLTLAHSSNIHHIRNCIGTIKSVGNFIKISAKRTELLKNKIKEFLPQTKWTKLTSMCENRWVKNHDGMLRFSEIYKPIVATLEELQLFVDIKTSSKALQLYKCVTTSEFIIKSDFSIYSDFINVDELPSELKLWKRKWIAFKDVDRPHIAVEALNYCNPKLFANIHFLLKVLATLPVSTATLERTFSTLKHVKTFLRNSTGQERLTGLALLSVHRDVTVNPDEVLNQFALQKDRNILLV
ncbi:hypothetical protein QTP88_027787 [Uroleucon formosanum]